MPGGRGPSGPASTLCRLLAGTALPDRGAVRLDGAQLHHYPAAQLAWSMGYLPQDVGLLPGTIAENIARMAQVPDSRAVLRGLARRSHEMILRLPSARPGSRRAAFPCRAGSGSGWAWPVRSTATCASWSWTSRTPTWTGRARRR